VISVVITLAGAVAVSTLPVAQYPEVTPPTVQVTALYPGANALTVLDTVAAPIEEQVSGVEGMMYMTSRCTNDGAYNLTITFKLGTDSDMAQVLVQNRVSLALPVIPDLVQNEGINVKKMSPNTLMIVNLISPDNRYNDIDLSNYATIYVRDELGRLPGVGTVTYLGQRDYSLRVWLDPDKMAALNLSGTDVVTAIAQQNLQVAPGQIGQQPVPQGQQYQLAINTKGRLVGPEEFGDIIVKTSQSGILPTAQTATSAATGPAPPAIGIVRIRDVVRTNKYYYRVPLDIEKLTKNGLTPQSVRAAFDVLRIRIQPDLAARDDKGKTETWIISLGGPRAPTADEIGNTVLTAIPLGKPIRLASLVSDAGIEYLAPLDEEGVQLGSQQYDQSCTLDGRPSVALSIFQLPGSNALDTATSVYAKMKDLKRSFPDGLDYQIVYDTTPFIRESVNEVFYTLRDAVILVAIVVLVFLQDWRAMILPMIDVPVSLIGTFAVMAAMHFTLNNLTLFGLVLAIGIVVDDAIVVLENIERLIATGLDARTATIQAMEEITGPVLAITLVLSSVFIPCCFLGGVTGQFFRQFAVTIAVSTIISAINAITMTPSRAVLIFKTEEGEHGHEHKKEALPWWVFGLIGGAISVMYGQGLFDRFIQLPPTLVGEAGNALPGWLPWLAVTTIYFTPGALIGGLIGWLVIKPVNRFLAMCFGAFNIAFDWMTNLYGAAVGRMLRLSVVVLLIYGGLLILTYVQFNRTPTGFIPQQDKGYLILNLQLPDSASVERTQRVMSRIEKLARDTEGVAHTVGVSGTSLILNANAPNLGSMYIMLKPFEERHAEAMSADEIGKRIQESCHEEVRGGVVSVFGAPPIDGLGTTGGFTLIVEDRGNAGLDQLQRFSDKIVERGKKSEGLQGLFNSSGANTPWLYLDIDRTKCLTLGVQVSDVFSALQIYMGSYYVNNYNQFGRTWQVNVQADPSHRYDVEDLKQLQVRNNQNQMVRLGSLMEVRDTGGPVMVMRYNMYSAAAITGDAAPGISSGQAMELMQELADSELPPSMQPSEWTDLAYLQVQAGNSAMYFFGLAVVFVFLVLAAQYESWNLPLAVILVVPMCLFCSVVGLQIAQMDVNIFTQIGFVVLVGLASKNAILIVEFAKQAQEAGKPLWDATVEACKLRLRPILMTSFAFILGVVPLVIAHGAGAEMRRSLGLAVFSGMLGVTIFGVFLTPVFFFVIQRFSGSRGHRPNLQAAPETRVIGEESHTALVQITNAEH
jgi:multidrug efflux pump subunit AcrB